MFKDLLEGLGDLIFPHNCILCSRYTADKSLPQLCSSCFAAIEFNRPPFCLKCSRHLPVYTSQGLCPTCLKYPIAFDQAWGIVAYTPEIQRLLHLFKYQQHTLVRKIFRRFLIEFLQSYPIPWHLYDYLLPVPLHTVRMRERGFNQSLLIAKLIAETHPLPIRNNLITRCLATQPQAFLDQKERWTNLAGAFRMKSNFDIKNDSILLVDDLLTTGATASSLAHTLRNAGARQVGLFVIAQA